MTKEKFFILCTEADHGPDYPSLSVYVTIERNLERVVILSGCWHDGTLTRREIYRPTPGRQGIDCYQAANKKCEIGEKKYNVWLEEWEDYHSLG